MTSREPGTGRVSIELDSNARTTVYSGSLTQALSATGTDNLEIGSYANGSSLMKGYLAETLIYRRHLSLQEKTTIRRYLGSKWGIAVR